MMIAILGGGLAGLTSAYRLHQHLDDPRIVLFEARDRLGGRALTVRADGQVSGSENLEAGWFDLGGSWFWSDQTRILALLDDLGISAFDQHEDGLALEDLGPGCAPRPFALAEKDRVTRRFVGGGGRLCHHLARHLTPETVHLSTPIEQIEMRPNGLRLHVRNLDTGTLRIEPADRAILTLPPQLILETIRFEPDLPTSLRGALASAPTWMGHAMKCAVLYPSPFWRERGFSGIVKSAFGPVHAFHDACTHPPIDGAVRQSALFGFFNAAPNVRRLSLSERRARVLDQLTRLFGPDAAKPLAYHERDWSEEPWTSRPHHSTIESDPRYCEDAFARPYLEGRLVFAGAETITEGGGYFEGAVRSADRAVGFILG